MKLEGIENKTHILITFFRRLLAMAFILHISAYFFLLIFSKAKLLLKKEHHKKQLFVLLVPFYAFFCFCFPHFLQNTLFLLFALGFATTCERNNAINLFWIKSTSLSQRRRGVKRKINVNAVSRV